MNGAPGKSFCARAYLAANYHLFSRLHGSNTLSLNLKRCMEDLLHVAHKTSSYPEWMAHAAVALDQGQYTSLVQDSVPKTIVKASGRLYLLLFQSVLILISGDLWIIHHHLSTQTSSVCVLTSFQSSLLNEQLPFWSLQFHPIPLLAWLMPELGNRTNWSI